MQVSHGVSAVFDDPNLVSAAGLAPVLSLAERAGLHRLFAEHLTVPGSAGANLMVKIPSRVAGMVAGADSISDMGLLSARRHGPVVLRGPGTDDAGQVPARVPLSGRSASSTRSPPGC